jgi:hypothetical protein
MIPMQDLNNEVINVLNNNAKDFGAVIAGLGLLFVFLLIFGIALWLVPIIIAVMRRSHLLVWVILIDLLLGWTVIGWVVAFVMAVMEPKQTAAVAAALSTPAAPGTGAPQLSPDKRYWWDGANWVDTNTRIPPGASVSPDGKYWWDGANWRNMPGAAQATPPAPPPVTG